ncbi:unnamed protein product [Rhizoctonia solani]|uniref:lytic cellulose monooxygenase (C4-dehydrogenating) n=2 Tax=Rhizoctonia solani TaxID=456999 RepID=A0A8H3A1Z3_9AGAM|nr:unnamed protein product [Rhizoctonia solani]
MTALLCFISALAWVMPALAHYRWTSLIVNDTLTAPYLHVRNGTNGNFPVMDVSTANLTCNSGGNHAGTTKTTTVSAGSTIGFALDEATGIFHHGVLNVYMAKAPDTALAFNGSGEVWFKIHELPPITDGGSSITFPTDGMTNVTFPIPRAVPSGEYLVRIEHIALHLALNYQKAEFYVSCAQVRVINGGSGEPKPLVALPGYYTGREPGIMVNIYNPVPANFTQPGPAVWSG